MHDMDQSTVRIKYTNYRGETSIRRVIPRSITFGSTDWHPDKQWLLEAFDLDKDAERSFALRDVHEWGISEPGANVPY